MIINLFSTPIISEELNMDLNSLSDYALSAQKFFPAGIQKSNLGGWHSNRLNEENIRNEEMKKLLELIINFMREYKEQLHIKRELEPRITSTWININRKGNISRVHIHPDCHFSAVFYVKVETAGNLGCLELLHPSRDTIDFCWQDIHEYDQTETLTALEISPKPNDLYIIPAWLPHSVLPHGNQDPRITITINLAYI